MLIREDYSRVFSEFEDLNFWAHNNNFLNMLYLSLYMLFMQIGIFVKALGTIIGISTLQLYLILRIETSQ